MPMLTVVTDHLFVHSRLGISLRHQARSGHTQVPARSQPEF